MWTPTACPTQLRRLAVGSLLSAGSAIGALAQAGYQPVPPAARLEVAPVVGWSGPRPSAALEIRFGLGDHFAGAVRAASEPWRGELAPGSRRLRGATFEGGKLEASGALGGGIRVYSGPARSGVFGGVDLAHQKYRVEAHSRLSANSATDALNATFFGRPARLSTVMRNRSEFTRGSATNLTISGGYALAMGPYNRLEVCLRLIRRSLSGRGEFTIDERDGQQVHDVSSTFGGATSIGIEARYAAPLWR